MQACSFPFSPYFGAVSNGEAKQFYISCAQLNITGGTGTLDSWEQPVQIPGVFKATDPGYTANVGGTLLDGFIESCVPLLIVEHKYRSMTLT